VAREHLVVPELTAEAVSICRLWRAILAAWRRIEREKKGRKERALWGLNKWANLREGAGFWASRHIRRLAENRAEGGLQPEEGGEADGWDRSIRGREGRGLVPVRVKPGMGRGLLWWLGRKGSPWPFLLFLIIFHFHFL
jgi:hypothetical protein